MTKRLIIGVATFVLSLSANAAPIDLSSWSELTIDYSGGQSPANWVLEPGNEAVQQQVNADPSMYLNNLNQTSYSMDGSWQVVTSSDDDYMGFVFGYQNSSNFYLFDWKQNTQSYVGATAHEGMTIKKMSGGTGNALADLSLAEFWENGVDNGDMEILAQNHSPTAGWADNALYNFHLDFNLNPGEIHISVEDALTSTSLWDVTLNDTTFTTGQFGFYNYSQQSVRYAGFEQEGGVLTPVPEPSTLALMSLALAGFGLRFGMRRDKKA